MCTLLRTQGRSFNGRDDRNIHLLPLLGLDGGSLQESETIITDHQDSPWATIPEPLLWIIVGRDENNFLLRWKERDMQLTPMRDRKSKQEMLSDDKTAYYMYVNLMLVNKHWYTILKKAIRVTDNGICWRYDPYVPKLVESNFLAGHCHCQNLQEWKACRTCFTHHGLCRNYKQVWFNFGPAEEFIQPKSVYHSFNH